MYANIEEVRVKFGIDHTETSDIRKELRKKLKELHPDSTNSEGFTSVEAQQEFQDISEAIEFIDDNAKPVVIDNNQLTIMLDTIKDLAMSTIENDTQKQLDDHISSNIQKLSSRYRVPKITTTAIAAILTALWVFPSAVKEHPILSALLTDSYAYGSDSFFTFTIIWMMLLMTTCVFWVWCYLYERHQGQVLKSLKIEAQQNKLFNYYISDQKDHMLCEEVMTITKESFMNYTRKYFWSLPPKSRRVLIDIEVRQDLANIVFARGIDRGVLKKIDNKEIEEQYALLT